MTREEAIAVLKGYIGNPLVNDTKAFEMAIKALEQEPKTDRLYSWLNDMRLGVAPDETTPKDERAERLAQVDVIDDIMEWLENNEQEPETGHWMTQWNVVHQKEYYYCSECREEFSYDGETGIKMNDYDYCPNCGARMEV